MSNGVLSSAQFSNASAIGAEYGPKGGSKKAKTGGAKPGGLPGSPLGGAGAEAAGAGEAAAGAGGLAELGELALFAL